MMIKTDGLTIRSEDELVPTIGTRTIVTITYEDDIRVPRDVMTLKLDKARALRDLLSVVLDNTPEKL
jgi:hypothetical protein